MGCQASPQQKDCSGPPAGGTGADGGGSGGAGGGDGADETAAGICADWDPDSYINYNRKTGRYEIDQVLVNDINTRPDLLMECDTTRMRIMSGGYYELYSVGRDDLATQLGLQQGDLLQSVNGLGLQWPDDYTAAQNALQTEAQFSLKIVRRGANLNLSYDVMP